MGAVLWPTDDEGALPKLLSGAAGRSLAPIFRDTPEPWRIHGLSGSDYRHLNQEFARLVLDEALEVNAHHKWLSGPLAEDAVFEGRATENNEFSQATSHALLAAAKEALSAREAASFLYAYGSVTPTPEAVAAAAKELVPIAERLDLLLTAGYQLLLEKPWLYFALHVTPSMRHKLYIGVQRGLPTVLWRSVLALAQERVPAFKVCVNPTDSLRPDRLVAYFPTSAARAEAASRLAPRLAALPSQDVPLAVRVPGCLQLFSGHDPDPSQLALVGPQSYSWRKGISEQLARALVRAQRLGLPATSAARFACRRASLDLSYP